MADKITQFLLDALTLAAADPGGTPLYATKSDPGLFPMIAAAKPAAKKSLDDGLIRVARTDTKGKQTRELCIATEKGLQFLLTHASPKQVLEDFVRVLEARESQVLDLLDSVKGMAMSLESLRSTVKTMMPRIDAARVSTPAARWDAGPNEERWNEPPSARAAALNGSTHGTATLATVEDDLEELAGAVLSRLSDWSESAGAAQDCPLPELFRSLTTREPGFSIGRFHDCLRRLHDQHAIYLHPWTGPLYALPEPPYALLVGHEVAYYASSRR